MSNGGGSRLRVNLRAPIDELARHFFHPLFQRIFLADAAGDVVATQFNLGKTFQIQLA